MSEPNLWPAVKGKVILRGEVFGAEAHVTVELALGGLYKGEGERVIGDLMDQVAAMSKATRWETFAFDRMMLKFGDGPWEEVDADPPKRESAPCPTAP